jgi:dipeptidyl aminopeptidase/acylaminoacyl peptidase
MIGDPESDAEHLTSRSPLTYADNIKAPLLVVQGANDPRVPRTESEQIVARLKTRNVEVRYDLYPDEGHGFTRRENQVKALSNAGEFLIAHLRS